MANAQEKAKPEDTEVWDPIPKVVTPGKTFADAPSDAIILFDGKNLDEWIQADDQSAAKWDVAHNILTVNKQYGNIETKHKFTNYQLHVEWREPVDIAGTGQARGNSGVFLASLGKGDAGYELQVLDSYKNKTYVNGMAGSIYKQFIPLANPARPPGEWQTYDITLVGRLVTIVFNGKTVICRSEIPGITGGAIDSQEGEPGPIYLQGDYRAIEYRNIVITPAK